MRSLYLNLKDKTNPALRNALVTSELSPEKLATMSKEEMASDRLKSLNAQIEKENLFKALAAGETMVRCFPFTDH
jgi:transcription elongation factor S-II